MSDFHLAEMTVRVWGPHGDVKHTIKMLLDDLSSVIEAQHLIMAFQNHLDEQHVAYEETQSKSRVRRKTVAE